VLTIVCLLWQGEFKDRNYTAECVYRLEEMVEKHTQQLHRFVCLSNVSVPGVECIPLEHDWPGWWSKIELFRPGLFNDRVLYLDLDVTVVGSLDDLADHPHPFCAIPDYQYPLQINSSVMAWDAGIADHIYSRFKPSVMTEMHGDQNWIHRNIEAVRFPRRWCPSYKAHVLPNGGNVPKDARVVVFHGSPKPWEVAPLA
jgi:hypothetical protein